jgi:hypothetical protein
MNFSSHLLVLLLPLVSASNIYIVMKMGDPKMPVDHHRDCKQQEGLTRVYDDGGCEKMRCQGVVNKKKYCYKCLECGFISRFKIDQNYCMKCLDRMSR